MKSAEELQAERTERKAARAKAESEQLAVDLEFINDLEIQHGDENVATLRVPLTDGLPVMVAARAPKPSEVKRYRARLKGKDPDAVGAAEEIGRACLIYPDKDVFEQIATARAGITAQLGSEVLKLVVGKTEAEGKE